MRPFRFVPLFVCPGGDSIATVLGSVWLTDFKADLAWRLDPEKLWANADIIWA
jgi:hypothetical protein